MKKLLSFALLVTLMLGLPSIGMAKGKAGHKHQSGIDGKVTAASENSITVEQEAEKGGKTQTVSVPAGTVIKAYDGSAAPKITELVGKHVKVTESTPGTAREITVE
jgi:RNase P/RNase MRP subunit p29